MAVRLAARRMYASRLASSTPSAFNSCLIQRAHHLPPHTPNRLNPTRQFHATPAPKAVGDNSTIDFAYLPSADVDPPTPEVYRVPILPNNFTTTTNAPAEEHAAVMKPEISSMSADAVFLPMADMSDGHAMNIDFHAMADRVAANLNKVKDAPAEEQASLMKQIWNDMVDDMIGARKKRA